MNRITIVVPCYNRAGYLPRTLKSIVESTYRPLSLILVDNGSTDDSLKICRDFASKYNAEDFSIVVTTEQKKGAAAARNCGLRLCKTPFVYFFDSDDEFDASFLTTVVPLLNDDIDVLAVPTVQTVNGRTMVRDYKPTASPVAQVLVSHLSTPSMVLRTDFLRNLEGWNEQLPIWIDWELGLRVLLAHPRLSWYTDKAFHKIDVHPDSITGDSFSSRIRGMRQTMEAALNEAPQLSTALYYRMEILTGRLLHEKNMKEAEENKKLTCQWFAGKSVMSKLIGFFLRYYVSIGGHGAWRIAFWLSSKPE